MRLAATVVLAVVLVAACSPAPAVGSKEWCDGVIKAGLAEVAKMPADQQQAAAKCAADKLMGQ